MFYFPAPPYFFDKMPAELLGSIYERYLSKTIRITKTRAIIEDKQEVRKAGGVYYTPKKIVDYIVEQTVSKLIKGKTPKQIEKLHILDPACGSGSFLISVYQKLLDYHVQYYSKNPRVNRGKIVRKQCSEAENDNGFKLTLKEKSAILRNNIFGVDIDPQAVEITMMSLYIKMLEDEHEFFSGHALLPRLCDNVKCGNSVIDYDIGSLSEKDRMRINPFDWHSKKTGFGVIMASGGFDAVIGNPPWVALSGKFGVDLFNSNEIQFLTKKFNGNTYMPNLFEYFVAEALSLVKAGGLHSFIVPDRLAFNKQYQHLRQRILGETKIISLYYNMPFPGITADTLIYVLI